ncbi:putative polyketide synthase [Xylaria longipes]|nr:putative polyketide synthase [Xylaria longipes]
MREGCNYDAMANEPIAIVGSACRFAGSASSPSKLWELLRQPQDLRQEIPESRFKYQGFYHPDGTYHGHSNVKHAYFLEEDPGAFDAEFFGIRPVEAKALDPQQRLLLEVAYEGLESAGMSMPALRGSDTAVYAGSMGDDYAKMILEDIQDAPTYYATGAARSILSNRVSYAFDWHGPSISIDTACSSSLVAVHMALQALRAGDCRMALACGTNLILGPENFIIESKLGMLSPDGRSRMWDQGANGYARGDGVAVLLLKTLRSALEDGDNIECIIRETGLNQDGATAGITMPSASAQAALIRKTYARAGLDLLHPQDRPQFFEAHGTGTPAGDPIEAEAIHSVFGAVGDGHEGEKPLYVGSIKTVFGHTEGTAGIAALLKASLALQNKSIPPNLLFEQLSDRVAPFYKQVEIPQTALAWPDVADGKRRASVNSFGFGGANAHAILESFDVTTEDMNEVYGPLFTPFVFSAYSEASLANTLRNYSEFLSADGKATKIHDLAWTLRERRSVLSWRTSIVASSTDDLATKLLTQVNDHESNVGVRTLADTNNRILGIFTGQGAQYMRMGAELIQSSETARDIIQVLESYLREIPYGEAPTWSLVDELLAEPSRIQEAAISQPLCTAIQILLVILLQLAGVCFDAVVGHSSGEIAAAYAAGFLSARDAMVISYYRGLHLYLASSPNGFDVKGAMLAVETSPEDAAELCADRVFKGRIVVAAVNSPSSVTLSGDVDAISELEEVLQDEGTFYRRLKVDRAYHSSHMLPCYDPYVASLRRYGIKPLTPEPNNCIWFSSVNNKAVDVSATGLGDVYWAENLTRPVLFSQAIRAALVARPCDIVLEVGPHAALKSPARSTILDVLGKELPYHGTLMRGKSAVESMSSALGYLWSYLGPSCMDLDNFERAMTGGKYRYRLVKGLPTYPWNHGTRYWHEPRASRKLRRQSVGVHPLLGHESADSAPHHLSWKHLLRVKEMPWLIGHRVQGQIVFPAAGFICAAIEGARHMSVTTAQGQEIQLIKLREFVIHQAIVFDENDSGVEAAISIVNITSQLPNRVKAHFTYSAAVSPERTNDLVLVASCDIEVQLGEADNTLLSVRKHEPPHMIEVDHEHFYAALKDLGYEFSGRFRSLASMRRKHARSSCLVLPEPLEEDDEALLIPPPELDACLQSIMCAYSYPYDGRLQALHLPTTIGEMIFNPVALGMVSGTEDASFSIDGTVTSRKLGQLGIIGHSYVTRGSSQHVAIRIQDAVFVPLGNSGTDDRKIFSKANLILSQPDGSVAARGIPLTQENGVTIDLLERIAIFYLRKFDRMISENHPARSQDPTDSYLTFARHTAGVAEAGRHKWYHQDWLEDSLEDIIEASKPFSHCPDVQIMHLVGTSMPRVFAGEGTMLEYFRADDNDILDRYYVEALGLKQSADWLSRTVKQLTDRYRHMNILEIGAGTGGATKAVFREINSSFSSYTYTDISAAFFENASSTFSRYKDRMAFKTLNVENDPVEQGFSEGTYDLVVCFFILHATSDITRCLRNIRKLLKPGGYLIVGEGQNAWEGAATMGFIFGPLSGWWVGAREGRILSPYVPIQDWDKHLQAAGFSGVETTPPKEFLESYSVFHFVSQAVDDYVSFLREPLRVSWEVPTIEKLVIIGGQTARTSHLVTRLQDIFASQAFITRCYIFPTLLDVDYELVDASSTVLCLTELDSPVFKDITADRFMALRSLFQTGKTLLWVTSGRLEDEPFSQMTVGLSRVAANEAPDLRIQQLEVADLAATTPEYLAEALLRFYATARKNDNVLWSVEPEIVNDGDGYELIPRIEQIPELNDRYNSDQKFISHEVDFQALDLPVCLEYNDGSYIASKLPFDDASPVKTECVEPLIKLRTKYSTLSAVKTPIGNRFVVIASCPETGAEYLTLMATVVPSILTAPKKSLVACSTHPGLSDTDYLSTVSAHLVATEILRPQHRGQTIMVHNAPEIVAYAIASQAAGKGVKIIYTTDSAGGETGPSLIRLPQHITQSDVDDIFLPAKLSSFVGFSQADTQASNERILMKCLKGRCQSFSTAETLYSPTVSESWSALTPLEGDSTHPILEAVQQIASADQGGCATFPDIVRLDALVGGSRPEDSLGIVDWANTALLPVTVSRLDRVPRFKSHGTYWIVGISRALGISLVDWLISNGATNVVITSRDPEIDQGWISDHKRKGVNVVVLPCDIKNESKLQSVHAHICATLPPILGVIQGAMVLHDTLLRNMAFEQFREVMGPKVDGSIYLDRIFYDTDLDFFLLISSINCVIGNVGQANYAAANTFMCGLAAHRRKRGLRSAAVNIGAIIGAGYVARQSRKEQDSIVERYLLQRLSEEDWCQAISEAIEACRRDSPHGPELTLGLTEVSLEAASAPTAPNWCSNPRFSALVTAQETVVDEEQDEVALALGEQLRQCQSEQEAYHVIEAAFATQLRVVLQVSTSDQDLMASRGNEIGLDSLISVDIRSWFLKHLQVNVPVLKIMSNNTMASLVQFTIESLPPELLPSTDGQKAAPQNSESQINPVNTNEQSLSQLSQNNKISPTLPIKLKTNGVHKTETTNGNSIDWNSESCPPADMADVVINTELHPVRSPPRTIVLTGSAGLLGHHMLSHFLSFPGVEKVYCLAVRSLPLRLKQNILPQDPRVSYHEGDLAEPLLGLSEKKAEEIFAEADVVVHNAADTSHLKPYVDVRTANVGSTVTLARLSLPRQIPFHYISSAGLGIYHEKSSIDGFPPGPLIVPPEKTPDGSFGYACSKYACERFLERMSAEYGMRVVIHRPSTIVREGADAIGPTAEKDWINAFLAYVKKLKAVPTMERKDGALDLVNVRSVCEDIARPLFASDPGPGANVTYVHEVGDEKIPLDTLADRGLEDQGKPYDIVPRAEWMARAISAGLHPGVAALIDGMAEGGEEYPKLLKGASS